MVAPGSVQSVSTACREPSAIFDANINSLLCDHLNGDVGAEFARPVWGDQARMLIPKHLSYGREVKPPNRIRTPPL